METAIFKEMIAVIDAEEKRRARLLEDQDPNFAYDQWLFTDTPFVNELYLMLLVSLRHQIERELVWIAARANNDGKEISFQQYHGNVRHLQKQLRKPNCWNEQIKNRLKLESYSEYPYMKLFVFWQTRTSTISIWNLTTT